MDEMFKVYVGGSKFNLKRSILEKIPYFYNLFDTCKELEKVIQVDRSSKGFIHVLEFVYDPLYQFPKEYAVDLDFYGLTYDKSKLNDSNREILQKMDILFSACIETNHVSEAVYSRYSWSCYKSGCKTTIESSLRCQEHQNICLYGDCTTKVGKNTYCKLHSTDEFASLCNLKECGRYRINNGSRRCFKHSVWQCYNDK